MIWLIAKKEFQNNIVTPGFIIGLLLCLLLIPYTVYTGIKTYENLLTQYEQDLKDAERVYNESQVFKQVNPLIVRPISPLSIFSNGISEQIGSKVKLNNKQKPVFSSDIVSLNENSFLTGFMSLDFTTVLAILLSLLGVLFSYDILSRERENGTLKLALSNSISRSAFYFGKITGIFLTLMPIILICFLLILIIIQLSPSVRFSMGDYGRIGILLLMSVIYFAFFIFLGGFISSCTKSSTSSIIINLFIWCFLMFLLPNTAAFLGKNLAKIQDYKQLEHNTGMIDKEFLNVQAPEIENILKRENLALEGYNYASGRDWDGGSLILFTPRTTMEYERRKKELVNPVILDNSDKKWPVQSAYLQELYRQEKTVRYLSCLSPSEIFKQLGSSLCKTGMESEIHFMDQVRQFQDVFYGYFLQNKIYSSYAFFTPQKESDFPENWEEAQNNVTVWKETAKPESTFDFSSFGYIDTSGFPKFKYVQPTIGSDLISRIYLLAGILIACTLLFGLSFRSFLRYDVR
jgi:ABC-type transport system involved in multi-copper enzyme maturation permease subunit